MSRRSVLFILFSGILPLGLAAQNPVQIENAKPGTSGWQLNNPALNREIEGYASLTSVNIGGSISFSVSTADTSFNIDIFRTGWYGGIGARQVTPTISNVPGGLQTTPTPDPVTGMIECNWPISYTLNVPGDGSWVSGIYLARLTGNTSGKQSWIIFVVRDDNRTSDILFQNSVSTYEAYNFWPNGANGKSLYDWAPGGRAWKVSYNRPYVLGESYSATTPGVSSGVGAGEYLTNLQPGPQQGYPILAAGFEYNMVRWLEQNGYDVTYQTDVDLHENPSTLLKHHAYLSVGHDEYWSMPMRLNLVSALQQGVNVAFFASNTMYWQVRFEPASNGAADRTMVCFKYDASGQDPDYTNSPQLATINWRDGPINLPEAMVEGVEYAGDPVESDIVISNASHWLFNGTGLHNGDHLTGILGYEVDLTVPGVSPSNVNVLASSPVGPFPNTSPVPCNTTCNSNVTWYSAGRAFVFATGSLQWSWGLDDYNSPALRSAFSSLAAQKLTANVLSAFIQPVTVTTTSLPAATQGSAYSSLQLTATGGGQPYTWSASGLPNGMSVSSAGVLSGTPTAAGNFSVVITATDAASHTGTATLPLTVACATSCTMFTISGQVTLSGSGLAGVKVSLNTGAIAVTNSAGNYSFSGLPAGTYTLTPALPGYTFSPSSSMLTISSNQTVNFTATAIPARTVSVNFVGNGTAMAASETAGVVAKTNWNNATGNVSSSPLNLVDETGVANGTTATWTSDNTWSLPITDAPGNVRMMRGYLDTGNVDPTTVNIAGLPASLTGYDVYVYADADNDGTTLTGIYSISGPGIATQAIGATDQANTDFSGTFTQATNSNGNYVRFASVNATSFAITATPGPSTGSLRAPLNGIQIVPSAGFSISASPSSRSIIAGGSTTYTVTVTSLNGFTGTVNLAASGLPSGASASFSPTSIAGGAGTSTLTITTTTSTPAGTSSLTITGTSGMLSRMASVGLTVTASAPDFSISASPASRSITAGGSTTYTVTVAALNGFTGAVNLAASGLPAGASASFSPSPITGGAGTSTMTVTTTTSTTAGTFSLTITGTSGTLSHTAPVSLTINPVPDFSISAAPSSRSIMAGGSTTYTVTVTALNGFTGTVSLAASGLPTGATASFSPAPITGGSGTSTMTVTTTASTTAGTFSLTITGTSGTLSHTAPVSLTVTAPPPDFTISASPSSRSVTAGGSTTYTITVASVNGFTGVVSLAASTLPAGASATFSPTSITGAGTSTMTVTTTASTPAGTATLTVTGTSGTLSHTALVGLTVAQVARTVSIDFVGGGTAMAPTETAGVVAKTNWNEAPGNVSSSPLNLVDETGVVNGATVAWTGDNTWVLPIADSPGNVRMMRGYLDTGNGDPSTVAITGLPASATGYDIYLYVDGDNGSENPTGIYSISGTGITTQTISLTDPANSNFSGVFQQAVNSKGNYIRFTRINATAFTITATPGPSDGDMRAPLNGIQIVPSPAVATARGISINFVGTGTAMAATETAGVVAKTNWNNATGNISSLPLNLLDETGAANGATLSWMGDNSWNLPITDTPGSFRMMRGYLDTGAGDPSTVTVAGLPVSSTGYDVYVYADADNAGITLTGVYSIAGPGITTQTISATDLANTNFSGTFTQATNSNGNYVRFATINGTAFAITATPGTSTGNKRAPVNGIQVVPH